MGIFTVKYGTANPVSFNEPGFDEPLEARFSGTADISEYDTSKYPDEEAVALAVRSGVADIAQDAFAHWPTEEIVQSQKEKLLASFLDAEFEKLGIKATFVVVTFTLTEESRQKYKDHMKKTATLGDLSDTSKQPKLSDLIPEEHGPLIEINYSHSSHGMAMGSGSSSSEKIVWQDDGSVIIESKDRSSGTETYIKYLAGSEAAEKLRQYVKDAHLAEMAQIPPIPCPFQITDYSSSAHMRFTFDDGKNGVRAEVSRSLDLGSYWKAQSDAVSGVYDLIKECKETGSCLENTVSSYNPLAPEVGMMPGFTGMGMGMSGGVKAPGGDSSEVNGGTVPPSTKSSGSFKVAWKCSCGTENSDLAKFCCNCGTPRPADKWKCPGCGAENSSKFCSECGTPKPQ
ncbi:MAG: hypothetical protein K5871_08310 [Lachnospiraceae bacterium]|nr:hypothetical protein [Lachnospiraceae bacterium]